MSEQGKPQIKTQIQLRIAARSYVDAQIETMRKYGSEPMLSPAEYDSLVSEMAEIGRKLWINSGGEIR